MTPSYCFSAAQRDDANVEVICMLKKPFFVGCYHVFFPSDSLPMGMGLMILENKDQEWSAQEKEDELRPGYASEESRECLAR